MILVCLLEVLANLLREELGDLLLTRKQKPAFPKPYRYIKHSCIVFTYIVLSVSVLCSIYPVAVCYQY